jgi:hypothetical protein
MPEDELTPDELEELERLGLGYPKQGDKGNLYEFFNKVLKAEDSIKVANLDTEELDAVRFLRNASLFSNVFELDLVSEYFKDKAEVILASSDSKRGFLINTAVTQKRQVGSDQKTKSSGGISGWFKKKDKDQEQ